MKHTESTRQVVPGIDNLVAAVNRVKAAKTAAKWRRVLVATAAAIVAMMLFPPVLDRSSAGKVQHVYSWLFAGNPFQTVDIGLLFTQFFVVGVLAAVGWVLCADKD